MGYIEELRQFVSEERAEEALTKPTEPSFVSSVSSPVAHVCGEKEFSRWVDKVSDLSSREPQAGHDARRWFNLVECSVWWLENFGRQAALDGWDSMSVFGVISGEPRAGGLIDRLGTSRTLVMDGKRSRWRSFGGVVMKYNAGAYKHLPLFWEAS